MSEEEFWAEVKRQFYNYENIISDLRFPEPGDVELYQLSLLTEHEFKTPYEQFYYAQPGKKMENIIFHLAKLGLPVPAEYLNLPAIKYAKRDIREIVTQALNHRTITPEFLLAWGEYNFSCAAIIAFISDDKVDEHHRGNVIKNIPHLVGKYVFAFWMSQHWTSDVSKETACDELNDHIQEIVDSDDCLPAWKRQALESMLMEDGGGIKKTYSIIPADEIKAMVSRAEKFRHLFEL